MTALLAAAASFAALAAIFVPLERAFAARAQPVFRPGWATDACFFLGQYLLFGAASVWVLGRVSSFAAALPRLAQPAWLAAVEGVVLGDFLVYWFHRACHRSPLLWRFHAVHHSAAHLDWLAAHREHPVDGILTQLCQNLPVLLLGLPMEAMASFVVFRGLWAVFIHSNVKLPVGPLRFLLGAPELHHWHHAKDSQHNFANLAPWLDVAFGTYRRPAAGEAYELGLSSPFPQGYLAMLAHPLRVTRARVGGRNAAVSHANRTVI